MKTIGLIGGMSWESTVTYYRMINEYVRRELGGLHSAKILLDSVDFAEIENYQRNGYWEYAGQQLGLEAQKLQEAGADMVLLCANTMHKVADQVQEMVDIPLVHIAKVTAQACVDADVHAIGLLGTRYTMDDPLFKSYFVRRAVDVIVPHGDDRSTINSVIYDELCKGVVSKESKLAFMDIIDALEVRGAQAIVLGCTELDLIVKPEDTILPVLDTTYLHATTAARLALAEG